MDNRENTEALKEMLQSDRNKVAVFVGAGASEPLRIEGWHTLMKKFAEFALVDFDRVVQPFLSENKYPEAASKIYDSLSNHDRYLQFMAEQFEPRSCNYTSLHEFLITNFQVILTTNYDAAFEKYCQRHRIEMVLQKLPNFSSTTLFQNRTLVYLHGNNTDGFYVFRKEEYDHFYPSVSGNDGADDLERFLYEVLLTDHVIFVGFSFSDMYFIQYFSNVLNEIVTTKEKKEKGIERVFKKRIEIKGVQHFAFIPESNVRAIEILQKFNELGVLRIITYKGDHHNEIEAIIEGVLPSAGGGDIEEAAYAK